MPIVLISKPVLSHFEEKAMSLAVFYCSICACVHGFFSSKSSSFVYRHFICLKKYIAVLGHC